MKATVRSLAVAAAMTAWLAVACGVETQPAGTADLGPRYVDTAQGFSLRPPAGAERRRETSATHIVQWSRRDADSGAIAWTLAVLQARQTGQVADLQSYAAELATKLRAADQLRVDAIQVVRSADRPTIDLHGQTVGNVLLWKRQAWVLAEPNRFLILIVSGSPGFQDEMNRTFQAVLDTLRIVDPQAERKARQENLDRGQKLLAGLTREKLQSALQPEPQWLLLELKGKPVGFLRIDEAPAERAGQKGVEIRNWMLVQLPGDAKRLVKQVMFTTADRKTEQWSTQASAGAGDLAERTVLEGERQQDAVHGTITQGGKTRTVGKPVPEKIYLPQALGALAPRLLDLREVGAYAFAAYSPLANAFDVRTISVYGPDTIPQGGRKVQAVYLTDQAAADAEPSNLWVDSAGRVLRIETADGLVMTPATHEAVLRRFADADKVVRELGS